MVEPRQPTAGEPDERDESEALFDEVSDPSETYWASRGSRSVFNDTLGRVKNYFRELQNSPFSQAISRNWLYYHGLFKDFEEFNLLDGAIQRFGPQGERSFIGVNHHRNLLHHLFVLTTRDRPAPQALAANDNTESLQDAQLVDGLLENYFKRDRVETYLGRAAEHAIVLTQGYVGVDWNENAGPEFAGDPETERIAYRGDLEFWNPSIFDVVYDPEVQHWHDNQWLIVRKRVNKYDLAATYPKRRTEILNTQESRETVWNLIEADTKTDRVSLWNFYHKRTSALQAGRFMAFTEGAWLEDGPLPAYLDGPPVYQVSPSEVLLTPLGYSPGFDLQGPQEAINMTVSNILTNHDAFGIQNLWSPPGNVLSAAQVSGGLRLLQCKVKPEPLQLTSNAPDAYAFMSSLVSAMEVLSGINSVTRGQPESSLKSGKALSLIEAKAVQYASFLIQSYYRLIEDVATAMVKLLGRKMGEHPRVTSIVSRTGLAMTKEYTAQTLGNVDRIVVESANPLTKTLAGRFDLAERFMDKGWVRTPEEITTVLTTGRLEPLLQADRMMLTLLQTEKDTLLAGEIAPVSKGDNHSLHLREQLALLNTPAVRQNEGISSNVLSHCLVHIAMLYLPDVQDLMTTQGFPVPQLQPTIPPGVLMNIAPEYLATFNPMDLGMLQGLGLGGGAGGMPGQAQPGGTQPTNGRVRPGGVGEAPIEPIERQTGVQ